MCYTDFRSKKIVRPAKNKNKNMSTIQLGSQLISVFGTADKKLALTKNKGMIISLVSAFFIVATIGLVLNLVQETVNNHFSTSSIVRLVIDEPVAYLPGQFVSSQLQQGYIGR